LTKIIDPFGRMRFRNLVSISGPALDASRINANSSASCAASFFCRSESSLQAPTAKTLHIVAT
jgi:hypothetical protein